MVLPLITPTGVNFIKDFPSQNAVNCNLIDAYASPCLTSHPLQTYTPILTGDGSNPALGVAGFIRGFYYKIFDQIYTWGEFRFGTSGIGIGSGTWSIDLPFPAKTLLGFTDTFGSSPIVGNGVVRDDSAVAGRFPLTCHLRSATRLMWGFRMNSGLANKDVNDTRPITWAINDGITWAARYKRDPTL